MLSSTKDKLAVKVQSLRQKLRDLEVSSADAHSGDAWHSSSYRILITEQDSVRAMLMQEMESLDNAEIISVPTQTDVVEIGHVVKVKFLDDEEFSPKQTIRVHILGSRDTQFIDTDDQHSIVISAKSPIGKSLLGHQRGDEVTYLDGLRARLVSTEDAIEVSGYFNTLEG